MNANMTTPGSSSPPGPSGMHHMHMQMHMDSGMAMYFHAGTKEYILLKQLRVENAGGMALACSFVLILGICFEGLKTLRMHICRKYSADRRQQISEEKSKPVTAPSEKDPVLPKESKEKGTFTINMCNGIHILQCFLHVLQLFIGYCLMLIFMTYNVWLCISVLIGAGIGYLFFGCHRHNLLEDSSHC